MPKATSCTAREGRGPQRCVFGTRSTIEQRLAAPVQPGKPIPRLASEARISLDAGNLDMGPLVVSFQHRSAREQVGFTVLEESMRKPRPATYNPAQALHLIASDRTGSPLSCPSCSGNIERSPDLIPPAPHSHVTLKCTSCGRVARYIAGAA